MAPHKACEEGKRVPISVGLEMYYGLSLALIVSGLAFTILYKRYLRRTDGTRINSR